MVDERGHADEDVRLDAVNEGDVPIRAQGAPAARRDHEGPQYDDEHVVLNIGEDGLVKSIGNPWVCSYCKQSTKDIDYDYLVGYDHLGCVLDDENNLDEEEDSSQSEFDKCVLCGKETPYLRSTHIDLRQGYVEGGGQGCFQPNVCGKN
jgi:hypothetical protein